MRALTFALLAAWCALATTAGPASAARAAPRDQLVMFQLRGCPYCAAWDREIGPVYAKTDEGKRLPLRRVEIDAVRPQDLRSLRHVTFTPTFILMHCGREFRRIEGYTGQDQFWGLLDEGLRALDASGSRSCTGP